ncbi:membrane metallo-endopeptidase-like 1 [Musca vetustissima]|uniref:membrane metallo-endopeptidase-like 1 n=1 Tax=Musca vetustissima TaxID=27455 RepID=UPI002AB70202|nr:membrane metallo-endopeptidase-like 1 [Musca vetustissima]
MTQIVGGQGIVVIPWVWRLLLLWSVSRQFFAAAEPVAAVTFDERRLQQISESMNPKLKACGDFYSYACDNWQGPEMIKILEERIQTETMLVLELLYKAGEPKFLRELYQYYVAYAEVENPQPLEYAKWLWVYENMQWPFLENKTSSVARVEGPKRNIEWLELLAKLRQFGFNDLFFHENIRKSKEDPYKGIIELRIPDLSYLYDFEQQVYILGDLVEESLVDQLATFQAELSKFTLELIQTEESDNFNYRYLNMEESNHHHDEGKLMTLKDLHMPWLNQYLQILLKQNSLDPNMQIQVQSLKYLKRIYNVLSRYDNEMLCNYIQVKFLISLMKDDRIHYKMDVVKNIRKEFPLVLQWIHGQIHEDLEKEVGKIRNLFINLKENFKKNLQSKALATSLVEYILRKLNTLDLLIFDKSAQELEYYYEHLNFVSSEYYGNRLRLNRFKFRTQHSTLQNVYARKSPEYLDFRPTSNTNKNGYPYPLPLLYPRLNIIYLPLTLLQEPFYDSHMGDLFSYSTLGYLLAHEITKAFDSQHLTIDANGVVQTSIPGLRTTSTNNEDENDDDDDDGDDFSKDPVIDDLAGLNLAYSTFAKHHAMQLPQMVTLSNKAISMEKVFFLNYAQIFCSSFCGFHPMADFHSYDACARVNTPVRHSTVFRQAFTCGALSEEDVAEFSLLPKAN